MTDLDAVLGRRLEELRAQELYRWLRRVDSPQGPEVACDGRRLLNFSSNDYLGLANHPALREAAQRAAAEFGSGSGASRLICGSLGIHAQLEEALAEFKGTEAAIVFSSGYATALGTIQALAGSEDVVIVDKLVHACIVDGARLSGATLRVYAHNDVEDLGRKLQWADARRGARGDVRVLVATESVFSMDGDRAPLREIVNLKNRFGAWLLLDEAHASGVYGPNRRGCAEELGLSEQVDIQMGTLGKALGAAGGYIAGSRTLIDYLINRARSFIFSTAPVPAAAGAALAGVRLAGAAAGEELRRTLWQRIHEACSGLPDGFPVQPGAIIPLLLGGEARALAWAAALAERGLLIPAIRYPTVPRGRARLRLTITAAHSSADIARLRQGLGSVRLSRDETYESPGKT